MKVGYGNNQCGANISLNVQKICGESRVIRHLVGQSYEGICQRHAFSGTSHAHVGAQEGESELIVNVGVCGGVGSSNNGAIIRQDVEPFQEC